MFINLQRQQFERKITLHGHIEEHEYVTTRKKYCQRSPQLTFEAFIIIFRCKLVFKSTPREKKNGL